MQPCLIAIDIDGTLLNSAGEVTARTRRALHAAHEAGIEIVIATGRRHAYAMRVLRDLKLCDANAVISSNGTVLRTVGADLIHRNHLSLAAARHICAIAGPYRDALVFTFDNVGPDGDDRRGALVCESVHTLGNSIDAWMRANEPYIAHVDRFEDAFAEAEATNGGSGPIQAMLCGSVDRIAEAEALLSADGMITGVNQPALPGGECVLHRTSYPERNLSILDILPAGCSKASAIEYLAVMRGCTLADVLAIGDNWNDLSMLQAAGRSILMSNAPAELRALAAERGWHIGPGNDEDGVAQAIEEALGMAQLALQH